MIRPIERRDNSAVRDIIRTVMPEYGASGEGYSIVDPEIDTMFEAYANPRARYFVLELNGIVCGGSGFGPLVGSEDPNVAELKKMYFLRNARSAGWGRKILDACLTAARAANYHTLYLETLERMPEARRLYERAGFQRRTSPAGATGHTKCDAWYERVL
jgi:putative acetyltransferase